MAESERCELVLNAVFYWEPVEFFQKQCDMITLRFFQDEPFGVVLHLLYARDYLATCSFYSCGEHSHSHKDNANKTNC